MQITSLGCQARGDIARVMYLTLATARDGPHPVNVAATAAATRTINFLENYSRNSLRFSPANATDSAR